MDNHNDWLFRYGVLLGKRYSKKQRLNFIKAIQKEFLQMAYETDATTANWEFAGSKKYFYNFYAGQKKNAKIVFATYYDTPVKSFGFVKKKAFINDNSRLSFFLNLIPSLVIFVLAFSSVYFGLFPKIEKQGWINIWGFFFVVITTLALFLLSRYRNGVPRRLNLVKNTSSILALLVLADKLKNNPNRDFAFAFVDGGINSGYGLKMAHEYFNAKDTTFIFIDSIGNKGDLHWFSDINLDQIDGIKHPLMDYQKGLGNILVTSGTLVHDSIVIKENNNLEENNIQNLAVQLDKLTSIINEPPIK